MISRRGLLALAPFALPRLGRAATRSDRKLLIFLCQGGWDTTRLFNPAFDNPDIDMEDDATSMEIGGFTLVDSPARPSVRSWFEAWHDRTAIVNGMELRSITHERCLRLLFTGNGAADADDWPSQLAVRGSVARALPYLVLSGPAYTSANTAAVVRVGVDGQLPDLLSGAALTDPYPGMTLPSETAEALQDQLLRERIARRLAARGDERFLNGYAAALEDLATLRQADLDLSGQAKSELCGGVAGQIGVALDALAGDHARCALIQYGGNCGPNWDQHSDIGHQSISFEELFQHLDLLMDGLSGRAGPAGGTLLDEVTVLVCSEMGRHPQVNNIGGKDHWTYTSCMLVGAGVRGDVTVGSYDAQAFGEPVDLVTGEPGDTSLLPTHLGATLYALGGVDPGLAGVDPIEAVLG